MIIILLYSLFGITDTLRVSRDILIKYVSTDKKKKCIGCHRRIFLAHGLTQMVQCLYWRSFFEGILFF